MSAAAFTITSTSTNRPPPCRTISISTGSSISSRTSLNENQNTNQNQNREDDVNDLFSAYMAQRKDKPFSNDSISTSGNGNGNGNSNSNPKSDLDKSSEEAKNSNSNNNSFIGSRLKQYLTAPPAPAPHLVEPISLVKSTSSSTSSQSSSSTTTSRSSSSTSPPNPPSLLPIPNNINININITADMDTIHESIELFTKSMQEKLNQLRTTDPSLVPSNAEEILQEIVQEQMSKQLLDTLASTSTASGDTTGELTGELKSDQKLKEDKVVKEIIQEAEREYDVLQKREEAYTEFRAYEESLRSDLRKRKDSVGVSSASGTGSGTVSGSGTGDADVVVDSTSLQSVNSNSPPQSFEAMQLDILQDLLSKRQEGALDEDSDDEEEDDEEEDYGHYTSDVRARSKSKSTSRSRTDENLELGIEELRLEVERQQRGGKEEKPESQKEWQMYRAIATKLAKDRKKGVGGGDSDSSAATVDKQALLKGQAAEDSQVAQSKLQGWKEFQQKEAEMREKSGLTIKYKLPFEWSDKQEQGLRNNKKGPIDKQKAEEARSEMDDFALEVLANLMLKTDDPVRKVKLQGEIEGLKEGIRVRLEGIKNRGPEVVKKKKVVPVTIGEALRGKSSVAKKKKTPATGATPPSKDVQGQINELEMDDSMGEEEDMDQDIDMEDNTDFFEDEIEDDVLPQPDSAFFLNDDDHEEEPVRSKKGPKDALFIKKKEDGDDDDDDDSDMLSLGSFEEQKFRSLVARSGVRTVEGQNDLKTKWEDFQEAEKKMRQQAGLSANGGVTSGSVAPAPKVDYDVKTLFKEDGDIDFDKILTSIGTRPSRKKKGESLNSETAVVAGVEAQAPVEVQPQAAAALNFSLDEVITTPDIPDIQEAQMKDIEKNEVAKVEALSSTVIAKSNEEEIAVDAPQEEEVAKPVQKKRISERGSMFFGDDSSQVSDGFEKRKEDMMDVKLLSVSQIDSLMQLKPYSSGASPYFAKINKPFKDYGAIFSLEGVLIDVTGLQYNSWVQTAKIYDFEPPLLEDVKFAAVHKEEFAIQRVLHWTDDVFAARKIAATYREQRRIIFDEWKESHLNQGEIESLSNEDDLVTESAEDNDDGIDDIENDVIGVQLAAWERTAESYGYQPPTRDLLNVVGTLTPDEAVRLVFRWTNDFVVSSDVGAAYRKYLKEETSIWLSKKGGEVPIFIASPQINDIKPAEAAKKASGPTADDLFVMKQKAWQDALKNGGYHFNTPTLDEIQAVEFVGLERAISSVFKWDVSSALAESMLSEYREVLKILSTEFMASVEESELLSPESTAGEDSATLDLPIFVVKDGVEHWLTALEDIEVPRAVISNMEEDIVEEILKSTKLSAFFPSENRVSSAAGYGSEMQQMLGGALRLERRPDRCVYFNATPQSAAACQQAEMKNVAIVKPYPYYELTTSDMTVRDFGSIGIRNLKNVFSEAAVAEPMELIESEAPKKLKQTLLKTRFWDDDGK